MAGHPISDADRRDRFRVGRCGKYERSPQTLERQRASARRFWSDPENRLRQSAITKAAMARARMTKSHGQ